MNMEKEFVPYEQALELRNLGFNEPCIGYYYNNKIHFNSPGVQDIGPSGELPIPTFSQAFRWFREKHKLQAEILWRGDMGCFCYKTGKFKPRSYEFSKDDYKTYEEAELACLKKLIEIVRFKSGKTVIGYSNR